MNQVPHIPPQVKDLIDQALNNTIDAEGLYRLDAALLDNPEIQKYFLDYCQLFMDLTVETRADQVIESFRARKDQVAPASISSELQAYSQVSLSPARHGFGMPHAWWFLGVSACLVFVSGTMFGWYSHRQELGRQPLATNSTPIIAPAAYLMSANGCNWNGAPAIYTVGSGIQAGDEIALSEGVAEFRLANGVYLSVEGPASVVLSSASTLLLQYGKVTSHVPWTVTDFKTIAGACKLTTRDSEFGVSFDGSRIEVHVFAGTVRAESPKVLPSSDPPTVFEDGALVIDETGEFSSGSVTAGNALALRGKGLTLTMAEAPGQKAEPEKFAAKLPMAGALPISQSYIDSVLASKPIGYWRFETAKNGVFLNEIVDGSTLKVVGDVRLMGRVGNSAVEFQPNSQAHLISQPIDQLADSDYSLEVWMKASHLHQGVVMSLYSCNKTSRHATTLELQGTDPGRAKKGLRGTVRYVHNSPGGQKTSCFSKKRYCIRRWQHLVAVKKGSRMSLYVDGKLAGSASDATNLVSELQLMLGWLSLTSDRGFVGQLDEAAIYNRALSPQEISRHFEIVKDAVHLPPESKTTSTEHSHHPFTSQNPFVLASINQFTWRTSIQD